jgi:hypothetical protein
MASAANAPLRIFSDLHEQTVGIASNTEDYSGRFKIFTFAIGGDLDGIKSLFNRGLASPFDVCESNKRTALHVSHRMFNGADVLLIVGIKYAAGYNHRGISQFLIDTRDEYQLGR